MVGVAQLVERRVVVADVAGSSPVTHPSLFQTLEFTFVSAKGSLASPVHGDLSWRWFRCRGPGRLTSSLARWLIGANQG
jgi:hypothetical protein